MSSEDLKKRTKTFAHRCVKISLFMHDSPLEKLQESIERINRKIHF